MRALIAAVVGVGGLALLFKRFSASNVKTIGTGVPQQIVALRPTVLPVQPGDEHKLDVYVRQEFQGGIQAVNWNDHGHWLPYADAVKLDSSWTWSTNNGLPARSNYDPYGAVRP